MRILKSSLDKAGFRSSKCHLKRTIYTSSQTFEPPQAAGEQLLPSRLCKHNVVKKRHDVVMAITRKVDTGEFWAYPR